MAENNNTNKQKHFKAYKAWRDTINIRREAYEKRTIAERQVSKAYDERTIVEKEYDKSRVAEGKAMEILRKTRDAVIATQEENFLGAYKPRMTK